MRAWKVIFPFLAASVVGAVLVGDPFAATPKERLREKQAQAQRVLGEVNALDARFGATTEAWNGARYELVQAKRQLASDRVALRVASGRRRVVMRNVAQRLVALYESDSQPSTISILLGSDNLGDLIDEFAAVHAVAGADHRLAVRATQVRDRYASSVRELRTTEQRRANALSELATRRAQIGSMLVQRRVLLGSIASEVEQLRVQEARRQELLAEQARERLAREQVRLSQRSAERARAAAALQRLREAAAKAAATAAAKAAATTTTAPAVAVAPPPPDPSTAEATTTTTASVIPPLAPAPFVVAAGHPEAATIALRYLGVPYHWGGASPAGFDCSGLTMYVYAQLGISLPHYAAAQYTAGTAVPRDQLQPGDLVFFDALDHVGIYIGGGQVVHAPQTGDVVKISSLSDWGAGYVGARRT
ncbi:MAG: NlpC/P60 family protein [Actinomycetota bacterium]|nr:NlpC/P60 family protein [Actinomycetota bacterium]